MPPLGTKVTNRTEDQRLQQAGHRVLEPSRSSTEFFPSGGNGLRGPARGATPRDNGIGAGALMRVGAYTRGEAIWQRLAWEDAKSGVRRRILQTQGRLMLMEVRFAAVAAGYEHSHVHEQISYCIAGRFEYSLDGRTLLLSEGESVYVPSNARLALAR